MISVFLAVSVTWQMSPMSYIDDKRIEIVFISSMSLIGEMNVCHAFLYCLWYFYGFSVSCLRYLTFSAHVSDLDSVCIVSWYACSLGPIFNLVYLVSLLYAFVLLHIPAFVPDRTLKFIHPDWTHNIWFSQWISVLHSHCSSNSRIEVFLFLIVFITFTAARGRGFTPEIPPGQTFEFSSGTTFPGVGGFVEGSRTKFGSTLR